MALAAVKWPSVITASKWSTVAAQLRALVERKRGKAPELDGGLVAPPLTNADVVAITMAYLASIGGEGAASRVWPLWAQFSAVAYGWDPARPARLVVSSKQAAAAYPRQVLSEFWASVDAMSRELDAQRAPDPGLSMDGQFGDKVYQSLIRSELAKDGAPKAMEKRVPLGCKRSDGSQGLPECKKRSKVWPHFCEEWECKPGHGPDIDPATPVKQVLRIALLVLMGVVLFGNEPRRSRRSRG